MPPADRTHLPRSPLKLVVCQLRFTSLPEVSEPEFMLALHTDLGGRDGFYARVERIQTQSVTLQVGPGASDLGNAQQSGWKFISGDGGWAASVMPDSISLETATGYISWTESFRDRLFRLLEVFSRRAQPVAEERLGLRYVDQLREPPVKVPQEWQQYLDPTLLGLLLHDTLGKTASASHQQIDLVIDDDTRCVLRHGFSRDPGDGGLVYILDTDAFREGVRAFDLEDIEGSADTLSEVANQVFQQCISPKLHAYLKEGV